MITFIFIISINYIVELFTYLIIVFNKLNNLQFNIAELNLDLNSLNITGNTVNSTVDPVSLSTSNTESSGSTNSSSSPSNTQGNNTTENTYRKVGGPNTKNSSTTLPANSSNNLSQAADTMLAATVVTGAMKLAQQQPSIAAKSAIVLATPLAIAGVIAAKNLSSNLTADLGKKYLSFDNLIEGYFKLTGDAAFDLLLVSQHMLKLALVLSIIIVYNYLILQINIDNFKFYLLKVFPIKFVDFYINSLVKLTKGGKIIIILLFIIIILCILISLYCIGFYIDNYDSIIDLYIRTKNK